MEQQFLYEINYTDRQQKALAYFEEIGVVVETVIMSSDFAPKDVYSYARSAALKGMHILAERYLQQFHEINPGLGIENYFQIRIWPDEALTGNKISFAEFLGTQYWPSLQVIEEASWGQMYNDENRGFVYAFLCPPYNIQDNNEGKLRSTLISDYLYGVLGVGDICQVDHLTIFSWSDNWSNYFDNGKEWWGTFCWTIYNTQNNTVAFIAASTTD